MFVAGQKGGHRVVVLGFFLSLGALYINALP